MISGAEYILEKGLKGEKMENNKNMSSKYSNRLCSEKKSYCIWEYKLTHNAHCLDAREGIVVATFDKAEIYCFDYYGNLLWKQSTGHTLFGVATNGRIIIAGSWDGVLYCYDRDGNQLWEKNLGGEIHHIDVANDGKIVVGNRDSRYPLRCLDEKGNQIWDSLVGNSTGVCISKDGNIIVSGGGSYEKLYDLYVINKRGEIIDKRSVGDIGIYKCAISDDGQLYAVLYENGIVDCFKFEREHSACFGNFHGTRWGGITFSEENILIVGIGTFGGIFGGLDADGKLIWHYPLSHCLSDICVSQKGDLVFISSGNSILCIPFSAIEIFMWLSEIVPDYSEPLTQDIFKNIAPLYTKYQEIIKDESIEDQMKILSDSIKKIERFAMISQKKENIELIERCNKIRKLKEKEMEELNKMMEEKNTLIKRIEDIVFEIIINQIFSGVHFGAQKKISEKFDDIKNKMANFSQVPKPANLIMPFEYDVFICHASEDKESFVKELAKRLSKEGLKVWYDEFTLSLGDSLRRSIDFGLANSKYGVVVLSENFFEKEWPQKELDGLVAKEDGLDKVILPIWHVVTKEQVKSFSPLLADRLAVSSSKGMDYVVNEILRAVKKR